MSAIAIGLLAGLVCFWAVSLKFRFRYDDSLDVVGIHLVGGIVGSVLLGVFAQSSINEFVPDGLLFGGAGFFIKQVVAVLAVISFTFIVSYLLARLVKAITGLRVDENQETEGLDISLHEERGYVLSE
jgi:Amt family ammonium transporter